jgi:predicted ester cyclase
MPAAFPCPGRCGRTWAAASHEFYRVADGLIAEEWICSDMASLMRQIS